jgi:hypothetical protein
METRLGEERMLKRMERISILGKIVTAFHRSNKAPRDFFPTPGAITSRLHISEILYFGHEEAFEELKNGITEQLPGLADQIRKDREETLLRLLPPGYTSPEPLKLATTWFSNSLVLEAARAEEVIHELRGLVRRKGWDEVGLRGATWSLIIPAITVEEKVMAAVNKLITDLGVGDPEKMTAEELDNVPCRVLMFFKDPKKSTLNMEVGSWRHLVRGLSSSGYSLGSVGSLMLEEQVQKVAYGKLGITEWRVLKDDELPDVTSLGQPDELWDCVHCWRAGNNYRLNEPARAQEHLLDA